MFMFGMTYYLLKGLSIKIHKSFNDFSIGYELKGADFMKIVDAIFTSLLVGSGTYEDVSTTKKKESMENK